MHAGWSVARSGFLRSDPTLLDTAACGVSSRLEVTQLRAS